MTKKDPSEDPGFESFDALPKRVRQPAWAWWRQPFGIAILCALVGAIALVSVLNRPRTISENPVSLLADVNANAAAETILIDHRGLLFRSSDLTISRDVLGLSAGEQACLRIQSRPFDASVKYTLTTRDQC